jgi:hypothetical protein
VNDPKRKATSKRSRSPHESVDNEAESEESATSGTEKPEIKAKPLNGLPIDLIPKGSKNKAPFSKEEISRKPVKDSSAETIESEKKADETLAGKRDGDEEADEVSQENPEDFAGLAIRQSPTDERDAGLRSEIVLDEPEVLEPSASESSKKVVSETRLRPSRDLAELLNPTSPGADDKSVAALDGEKLEELRAKYDQLAEERGDKGAIATRTSNDFRTLHREAVKSREREGITDWERIRRWGDTSRILPLPVVVLLALAAVITILLIWKMGSRVEPPVTTLGGLAEQRAESLKNLEAERGSLNRAISGYLEAESVAEKLRFARRRDIVEPLMSKYYQTHPEQLRKATIVGLEVLQRLYRVNRLDEDRHIYITAGALGDGTVEPFIVEELDGAFKVDWETHVRYNPMTRDQLLEERPLSPIAFRVYLNLSDRYIAPFNPAEHVALELVFPDKIDTLDAFIARDNLSTSSVLELVAADYLQPVIVNLKIPADFPGQAVLIDSLVQPRWFIID